MFTILKTLSSEVFVEKKEMPVIIIMFSVHWLYLCQMRKTTKSIESCTAGVLAEETLLLVLMFCFTLHASFGTFVAVIVGE